LCKRRCRIVVTCARPPNVALACPGQVVADEGYGVAPNVACVEPSDPPERARVALTRMAVAAPSPGPGTSAAHRPLAARSVGIADANEYNVNPWRWSYRRTLSWRSSGYSR